MKTSFKGSKNNKGSTTPKVKNAALEWVQDFDLVQTWAKKYNLPKMLKKNNGIVHIKNFFPTDVAEGALKMMENFDEKTWIQTEAAREYQKNNVSHSFKSIKQNKTVQTFSRCFELLVDDMLPSFQVARYMKSDHIEPHDDKQYATFQLEDGQSVECSRRIALIVYLTKDWKKEMGGLLKDVKGDKTFVPEFNSAIAFDVPRMHEVTPLTTNRPRYTFFGWYYTPGHAYELDTKKESTPIQEDSDDSSLALDDSEPEDSEDEIEVDLDEIDGESDEDADEDASEGEMDLKGLFGALSKQAKLKTGKATTVDADDDSDLDIEGMDLELDEDDEDGSEDEDGSDGEYSWDEDEMQQLMASIADRVGGQSGSDEDEEEDDEEVDEPSSKRRRVEGESDEEDEDDESNEEDEDGSESEQEYEECVDENGEIYFPTPKTEKGRQQLQSRVESMLFEGVMKSLVESKLKAQASGVGGPSLLKSLVAQDPTILTKFMSQLEEAGDSSGEEWTPADLAEGECCSDEDCEEEEEEGQDSEGSEEGGDDEEEGHELNASMVPALLDEIAGVSDDEEEEDVSSSEDESDDNEDGDDEDEDEDMAAQKKVLSLIAQTVLAPSAAKARAYGAAPEVQKLIKKLRVAQAQKELLEQEIATIAGQITRKGGKDLILPAGLEQEDGSDDEGADVSNETSDEKDITSEESSEDEE